MQFPFFFLQENDQGHGPDNAVSLSPPVAAGREEGKADAVEEEDDERGESKGDEDFAVYSAKEDDAAGEAAGSEH